MLLDISGSPCSKILRTHCLSRIWKARTWAGSIHALSFGRRWVNETLPLACRSNHTRGSRVRCSAIGLGLHAASRLGLWLLDNGDSCRPNEHAVPRWAVEVPLALNCSIILSRCVLKFHSNPRACCELSLANKSNYALLSVRKLDPLTNLEFWRVGHPEVVRSAYHCRRASQNTFS